MRIKLTKSGISFGSLVKLYSVGYFIGMGILLALIFIPVGYLKWGQTMPIFLWLMFPVLIAIQSLFTAVVVAAGVKLYGKVSKCEVSYEEELQQSNQGDGK